MREPITFQTIIQVDGSLFGFMTLTVFND